MKKTQLARYFDKEKNKIIKITVEDYEGYLKDKDKKSIANFVKNRFSSRYIVPHKFDNKDFKSQHKNGFLMMASYCLLIEALQSFKNGWGDSNRRSEQAFKEFFKTDKNFRELQDLGSVVYKNVRCGILHQGETTNGWKITRKGKTLYKSTEKKLDAVLFGKCLERSLNDYSDELLSSAWDSKVWDNFRRKMRRTIAHC